MSYPKLINNGWLSVPWAMVTGQGEGSSGVDAALGHGPSGNQFTFAIFVNWDDLAQATLDLLGTHDFDPETGFLSRTLPKQHPLDGFEHLYISRIVGVKPRQFLGKRTYKNGVWSNYSHAAITLVATQPHYRMLDDATIDRLYPPVTVSGTAVRQEWNRMCEFTWTGASEVLSREAGSFFWTEGPQAPTGVTVPVAQYLGTPDLLVVFRQVPWLWLVDPVTLRPERLMAAMNTVNSVTLFGCPPGTLLFATWTFAYNECPYPARALLGQSQGWPSLTVDCTLQWKYRNPQASGGYGSGSGTYQGWNTTPTQKDNIWYRINTKADGTGNDIFPSKDHRLVFTRSP